MLVDKIWAKMDGFGPLLGQNYKNNNDIIRKRPKGFIKKGFIHFLTFEFFEKIRVFWEDLSFSREDT